MKRALVLMLALAACSHGSTASSSGTASTSPATTSRGDQTAVIQPSELSPEQVRMVQRALWDHGFALNLTGTFDDPTQAALTDFQRARGLPATGNLNQPTIQALGLDPRDVMPVRGSARSSSGSSGESTGGTSSRGTGQPGPGSTSDSSTGYGNMPPPSPQTPDPTTNQNPPGSPSSSGPAPNYPSNPQSPPQR